MQLWYDIATAMEDVRVCSLSIGDQSISIASTRGSMPFSGAACFLVTDIDVESVS